MTRRTRDVEAGLEAKGFLREDSHHKYFIYYTISGKKTIVHTYTSHGSRELDKYLCGQMAKQCKLSKDNFGKLIDCPLSREEYENELIEAGHVAQS